MIETTLAGWIRTAVAVMAFGALLVRYRFLHLGSAGGARSNEAVVGIVLVALGAAFCFAAAKRYSDSIKTYRRGEKVEPSPTLAVGGALLVAIVGLALIAVFWPVLMD